MRMLLVTSVVFIVSSTAYGSLILSVSDNELVEGESCEGYITSTSSTTCPFQSYLYSDGATIGSPPISDPCCWFDPIIEDPCYFVLGCSSCSAGLLFTFTIETSIGDAGDSYDITLLEDDGSTVIGTITITVISAPPETIIVNWDGSGDYTTIQAGINAANDGDTVIVADGTYTGDGNRDININKVITLRSENGAANCIIDCQGSVMEPHRAFLLETYTSGTPVLRGFTVTNGYSNYGSAVNVVINAVITNVKITDCVFTGNAAGQAGSAINCGTFHSPVEIVNCTFTNNTSTWGGVINVEAISVASIRNCIIWGNYPLEQCGISGVCGERICPDIYVYSSVLQSEGWCPVEDYDTIIADPCFADPENGNFHLLCTSPCVDAGDPDYIVDVNEVDMDGQPRVMNGRIDMGADEVDPNDYEKPAIRISDAEFEFTALKNGPNPDDQILQITNPCGGTLRWQIEEDCDWLEVYPNNGTSASEPNDVVLSVDISGLDWGSYNCELTVSDPNAINNPRYVGVNLEVLGPIIELSASEFEFDADEDGPNPDDQILTIRNSGTFTLNWQITENCDWLDINPNNGSSTGEPDDVILSVDTAGLNGGSYYCELTVSDPEAINNPQTVNIALYIFGAALELSQSQFAFSALEGGTNPADKILTVRNSAGGTLYWHITEECDWLSVNPGGGSSTGEPNDVTLSVDISGLENGDYECELTVFDPNAAYSPQTVNVSLDVIGPTIWLSDSQIGFTVGQGGPNPADQTLNIRNTGGATLYWQTEEECDWLEVNPTSGTSTGELDAVTLSVDANNLDFGKYNCQMTVSDPNAENSPRTVQVLLDVFLDCYEGSDYDRWVSVGRPRCWCSGNYQTDPPTPYYGSDYQCKGDTDGLYTGKGEGAVYVDLADLAVFNGAWQKPISDPDWIANADTYICADFDHEYSGKGEGLWRVTLGDLIIFNNAWQKPISDPYFTDSPCFP